jgi:hypothetical protein
LTGSWHIHWSGPLCVSCVSGVFGQTCEDCLKVCYVVVEEDEDDDEEDTRCLFVLPSSSGSSMTTKKKRKKEEDTTRTYSDVIPEDARCFWRHICWRKTGIYICRMTVTFWLL